jgi:hypothetical protein
MVKRYIPAGRLRSRVQRTENLSAPMTPEAGEPMPQSKLTSASSRTRAGLPLSVVLLKYSPRQLVIGACGRDGVFVKLDLHQVMTGAQALVGADRFGRVVVPLVDDQSAVYPDPDPVVAGGRETIRTRLLVNVAGPARGEVVRVDARTWRAGPPVVVQVGLAALEHWGSGKRYVVPI